MEQHEENHEKKSRSAVLGGYSFALILVGGVLAVIIAAAFLLRKNDIMQRIADWKNRSGEEVLQVQASETDMEVEPEELPETQTENLETEEEEYATSHIDGMTDPEAMPEPVETFPIKLSDVYAEKGSVAAFRCYDPEATNYLWETYDPQTESWTENEGAVEVTDELYRKISTFLVEADDKNNELAVRCRVSRESADDIVGTAALYVIPEITGISGNEYISEAGVYAVSREIPVQVIYKDGSQDTITGLNGLYFLKKEESSEQGTAVSGNMTEIVTTIYTACDYDYLAGEREEMLRYQGRNGSLDTSVRLIAEDRIPPEIKEVSVGDFDVSTIDQPVPVTITIIAEDEATAYPELVYAFLPEGEEPEEEDWIKGNPTLDVSITQNGTWVAYCKDLSGNIATQEKDLVVVDNKPPVVNLSLECDTWCSENRIIVKAKDGLSMEYHYSCAQTGEDSGWITRNEYTITQNGIWIVKVRDAVGNVTEQEILVDNIDHQAPVIRRITEKTEIEGERTTND